MSENLPALPEPALKRMPTGNVYFSPQQMTEYAQATRVAALREVRDELARSYDVLGDPVSGSYDAGQATALDVMEGWVEKRMEQPT